MDCMNDKAAKAAEAATGRTCSFSFGAKNPTINSSSRSRSQSNNKNSSRSSNSCTTESL